MNGGPQALENLLLGELLELNMAARRQGTEPLLHRVNHLAARKSGNRRKQPIKAEVCAVSTDEIQDEAALLPFVKTQAAANLLLKEHGALCGTEQEQGVNRRQVNALIVQEIGRAHV